jgi:hypothetical protein
MSEREREGQAPDHASSEQLRAAPSIWAQFSSIADAVLGEAPNQRRRRLRRGRASSAPSTSPDLKLDFSSLRG